MTNWNTVFHVSKVLKAGSDLHNLPGGKSLSLYGNEAELDIMLS